MTIEPPAADLSLLSVKVDMVYEYRIYGLVNLKGMLQARVNLKCKKAPKGIELNGG